MGVPNCSRPAVKRSVWSRAPWARPSASAAMPIRPASSVFMKLTNPSPSSPSRFSAGTSASSRISSRVSDARHPILSSFLPARTPGVNGSSSGACPTPTRSAASRSVVSFVTMKLLMPRAPFSRSVTAVTTNTSPTPAWVMKILLPLSR